VEAVTAAQAAGLESRAIVECSCWMSVAEVSERHLSGVVEVGREAHQDKVG
jgi:hypothetical protein